MASTLPKRLTDDVLAVTSFLDNFDVFLFDCDGVLWSGDHVFPGTVETLQMLREARKQIIFVTNNSTKSRRQYSRKLEAMGIPATEDEVFGSSYSAAIYISRILKLPAGKDTVFVLGEGGIEEELTSEHVKFIGGTDPRFRRDMEAQDFVAIASGDCLDDSVGAVLVGLDFHLNYLKLAHAFAYLQRGAVFLATNVDNTLPNARSLFPGAGSISAPLTKAIGKEPLALGKPSQAMMDAIEGRFRLERARACMIGDRLNTDIKFGIEGKLGGTLAVLTGVSKQSDWEQPDASTVPKFYADKLSDILIAKQGK